MAIVATGSAAMEPTPARAQLTSEQTTLPNGLTVVSAQRPDAETVALTLTARAGARFEDPSTDSAARFLERMYQQGTPGRPSRDAIMRTVTSRGGLFSVGTGWEFMDFSLVVAPEDLDVALDLLTDVLANSTFDPDRIEHQRGLLLRELAERRENPSSRAFDLFYLSVFRDHELRFLPTGSVDGVTKLDRDTILRYRDERLAPSNMVLGLVSPYTQTELLARLAPTLGTLASAPEPPATGSPPPPGSAEEIQYALGRDQATVLMGGPTPGLSHPDRYPLWLLQTILGPGGGRLFYDIRDVHGLAYDTSMRLALTSAAGSIIAYAGTDPANIAQVRELLAQHLNRAREELVTEAELENAIGYLVGGTVVGLESGSAQAGQLAHNTALGLPLTTAELEANLRAVRREDIRRVAQEYLAPARLTTVVVAPGS